MKKWDTKEVAILKKWYPIIGINPSSKDQKSLMEMLERSKHSLRRKAVKLGLKTNNQNYWTDSETKILKKWYPKLGYRDSNIRKYLGLKDLPDLLPDKYQKQMMAKAHRLGIKLKQGLPKDSF